MEGREEGDSKGKRKADWVRRGQQKIIKKTSHFRLIPSANGALISFRMGWGMTRTPTSNSSSESSKEEQRKKEGVRATQDGCMQCCVGGWEGGMRVCSSVVVRKCSKNANANANRKDGPEWAKPSERYSHTDIKIAFVVWLVDGHCRRSPSWLPRDYERAGIRTDMYNLFTQQQQPSSVFFSFLPALMPPCCPCLSLSLLVGSNTFSFLLSLRIGPLASSLFRRQLQGLQTAQTRHEQKEKKTNLNHNDGQATKDYKKDSQKILLNPTLTSTQISSKLPPPTHCEDPSRLDGSICYACLHPSIHPSFYLSIVIASVVYPSRYN